jgi:NTP pyrophosphatase (non-canonical NTP hydrolase)
MQQKQNDQTTSIRELRNKVKLFRDQREWRDEDPKDIALSLVLEAAELLEHFQWMKGEQVMKEARLYGPICDELSDVLWWILVMADRLGIDVTRAFDMKMEKNEKKYPAEMFSNKKTLKQRRRAYYQVKAKYRGGHPLAEEGKGK